MKKLLLTLALLIGGSTALAATDGEFGVEYNNGSFVPFLYLATDFPLGQLGSVYIGVTPSLELILSDPLEGWIQAEFQVDTEPATLSMRLRFDTTTDALRLRAGILFGF